LIFRESILTFRGLCSNIFIVKKIYNHSSFSPIFKSHPSREGHSLTRAV
jgi:hypothetical protein